MTEQTLFRFAMILQNQAPSTLNKYICRLAEAILSDYPNGISLYELSNLINTQFSLAFTEEEIAQAIIKKGLNHIVVSDGVYSLTVSAKKKITNQVSFAEELREMIDKFIIMFAVKKSADEIYALLLRYLYFCFNSNVENLLSLFENQSVMVSSAFEAQPEEISVINDFITWNNSKKDALIYNLIATCYEYCMLTIKKDKILSTELFKGKRFYLDANIIFRMAGINNEERKTVTQGFIDHCRQAGIKLYCTSATLDEVYRVIAAQVEYIKSIAGFAMPVSYETLRVINPNTEINDFYRIYCNWCNIEGNRYGDYTAFSKYLLQLVHNTLSQLKIKGSNVYKIGSQATQYSQYVASLKNYKNEKRAWRYTSTSSAETDVTNVMDAFAWRTGTGANIWQTNDFIVSADQLLIAWCDNAYSGVPIVVLPSVWLAIILRFTGRTDDDYKSFCLFLTQRHHIGDEDIIDPIKLLKTINERTCQTDIKEQIIVEITQNKSNYSFKNTEEYSTSAEKAFDKVLEEIYGGTEQKINEAREKMKQQIEEIEKNAANTIEEEVALSAVAERERTIVALSKKKAADAVYIFRCMNEYGWTIYLASGLLVLLVLATWIWEIGPMYMWMVNLLPAKIVNNNGWFVTVWTIFTIALGLISKGIKGIVSYLGGEKREDKLYKRYYRKSKEVFRQ